MGQPRSGIGRRAAQGHAAVVAEEGDDIAAATRLETGILAIQQRLHIGRHVVDVAAVALAGLSP